MFQDMADVKEGKSSIDVKGGIRSVLAQKGNVTREKRPILESV